MNGILFSLQRVHSTGENFIKIKSKFEKEFR